MKLKSYLSAIMLILSVAAISGFNKKTEIKEITKMEEITFHSNPIIKNIYTADPAPMVYGDTLYLYTTHDEDQLENNFYTMKDWRCFSTKVIMK